MFSKPPEEVIGYKVRLGGGRSPEVVIGKLIYGRKPKWLSGRGHASKTLHGKGAAVSVYGHGSVTVHLDSLNYGNVIICPGGEGARIVAEGLAGKVGKARPYTAGEWADDYAIDYAQANGEPVPERRYPLPEE